MHISNFSIATSITTMLPVIFAVILWWLQKHVEHTLVSCKATSDVPQRMLSELINVILDVHPLSKILLYLPPLTNLTQFLLDCSSINLPIDIRVPIVNPGTMLFSWSEHWSKTWKHRPIFGTPCSLSFLQLIQKNTSLLVLDLIALWLGGKFFLYICENYSPAMVSICICCQWSTLVFYYQKQFVRLLWECLKSRSFILSHYHQQ